MLKMNRILKNLFELFLASIIAGIVLMLMRCQETYFLESKLYYQFNAYNLLLDTSFVDLKSSITLSVLLLPLALVFKNIRKSMLIYFTILVLLNAMLTKYFLSNFELLGSEMFEFSVNEMLYIVNTEISSYGIFDYILLIFLPLLFIIIFILIFRKLKVKKLIRNFLAIAYVVILFFIFNEYKYFFPSYRSFNSYHQYMMHYNKLTFFLKDNFKQELIENKQEVKSNLKEDILLFQKANKQFNYIDQKYPLLHNTPYQNVLGKYFKEDTIKPNIVFLMIEGLARSFSGPDAHLGSFTPFLDSLKNESLYWSNFLSGAERTYGVLPNSLASAPHFNQFLQKEVFIKHNSLIKEIHKYNYYSSFNYGGWANFSSMSDYLKFHKIDTILADNSFDTTIFKTHESSENDFHWGYDDEALLKQYLIHSKQFKEPYLSIILTISMHSPFDVSENYTIKDFRNHLGKITEAQEKLLEVHPKVVKSIAFVDEQLEDFFKEYKKREDFKNTIFLIYGDHNMHVLPEKNEVDAFHVPLIIYSDLLLKTDSFKGVCTHRDITPTLLGLFEGNYGMKFKEEKHWLGTSLDTSKVFRCNVISPLVLGSSSFVSYIYKNYMVVDNEVYKLDSNLNLTYENNHETASKILKIHSEYSAIENYMLEADRLFKE